MALHKRAWIAAGIAMAAGVGLAVAVAKKPRAPQKGSRILLVGDSLAVGLSRHLQSHAEDEKIAFDALAKEGTRVDQWLRSAKLAAVLVAFRPDLILVSLGTNDAYSQLPDVGVEAKALVDKLSAEGAEVVWIGPPTLPERSGALALRPEVLEVLVDAAPFYFPSDSLAIERAPDRIHPTPRGYAAWAGAIWSWLS